MAASEALKGYGLWDNKGLVQYEGVVKVIHLFLFFSAADILKTGYVLQYYKAADASYTGYSAIDCHGLRRKCFFPSFPSPVSVTACRRLSRIDARNAAKLTG